MLHPSATTAAIRDRLKSVHAAFTATHKFKPGDIVHRAAFIEIAHAGRPSYSRPEDSREAIVLETVPSLRKFLGCPEQSDGQGILVAFVTARGEIALQWIGAWQYVPAPTEDPGA